MYNLFVESEQGRWNKPYVAYEWQRVFEHTAGSLREKYKVFDAMAKERLIQIPSLFAYESQCQMDARVGWITSINVIHDSVEVEFEIDSSYPPISDSQLRKLVSELDIQKWEMNRTHWAIKNINLFNVLFDAGLIQDRKPKEMQVFLCYASEDRDKAVNLYNLLSKHGIKTWIDKKDILPGQDWEVEIQKTIRNSHAVVVCLSSKSTTKEGFVQKEIRTAMDIANEKPEGTIFIIPARFEDCKVPKSLNKFQWVDLYLDDGVGNLIRALRARANDLGVRIRKS
jgi:hypothetical protein